MAAETCTLCGKTAAPFRAMTCLRCDTKLACCEDCAAALVKAAGRKADTVAIAAMVTIRLETHHFATACGRRTAA